MVVDISNLDSMIRGYITNVIKQYYPEIDTSENSAFDDLYIKPLIEFSRPFIDSLSKLELKSNLSNFEYLTESELDEIGEGNYFTARKQGTAATTNITLTFSNLNIEDEDLVIKVPTGATFATGSGLEFQTQTTTVLTVEDLKNNYNKQRLVYEVDIPVVATDIGTDYNVYAGEIIYCKTYFSNSLVSSVNKNDVVDGRDKESNQDYVDRIKEFYLSRQLGTAPGYRRFVMDLFDEITDVYVSGYKDEYMQRDLVVITKKDVVGDSLTELDDGDEILFQKHMGGAVDLYLKGCLYDENTVEITLNNNIKLLDCSIGALVDSGTPKNSIKLFNLTDSTKTPVIKAVEAVTEEDYGAPFKDKTRIIIDNTGECSYTDGVLSSMKVIYSFYDDEGQRVDQEEYFQIGLTEAELAAPIKSIDTLKDHNDEVVKNIESRITVVKTGIEDTTDESCKIIIDNCPEYFNGISMKVVYTSNKTLRQLRSVLFEDENRIVTADIVGKEATAVPVNIALKIKVVDLYKDVDTISIAGRIKSSIISFFNNYRLGNSVEQSDLVGWLYTDPSVNEMIQYVALPFDAFYVPEDITESIPFDDPERENEIRPEHGVLPIKKIEYPVLNASKFSVTVI